MRREGSPTASWRAGSRRLVRLVTGDAPPPAYDAAFDAGDLGCGELLLALRTRIRDLAPGSVLKLSTTDPGAREDLPAWCRMTGHRLVLAAHPAYFVRKGP